MDSLNLPVNLWEIYNSTYLPQLFRRTWFFKCLIFQSSRRSNRGVVLKIKGPKLNTAQVYSSSSRNIDSQGLLLVAHRKMGIQGYPLSLSIIWILLSSVNKNLFPPNNLLIKLFLGMQGKYLYYFTEFQIGLLTAYPNCINWGGKTIITCPSLDPPGDFTS